MKVLMLQSCYGDLCNMSKNVSSNNICPFQGYSVHCTEY